MNMKLYITTPSPFARKVRIVAHEKGLADRIEEIAGGGRIGPLSTGLSRNVRLR